MQSPSVTCTADYDFAVVKATQGTGFTNGYMTSQANCVRQRGKSLGFYHYRAAATRPPKPTTSSTPSAHSAGEHLRWSGHNWDTMTDENSEIIGNQRILRIVTKMV